MRSCSLSTLKVKRSHIPTLTFSSPTLHTLSSPASTPYSLVCVGTSVATMTLWHTLNVWLAISSYVNNHSPLSTLLLLEHNLRTVYLLFPLAPIPLFLVSHFFSTTTLQQAFQKEPLSDSLVTLTQTIQLKHILQPTLSPFKRTHPFMIWFTVSFLILPSNPARSNISTVLSLLSLSLRYSQSHPSSSLSHQRSVTCTSSNIICSFSWSLCPSLHIIQTGRCWAGMFSWHFQDFELNNDTLFSHHFSTTCNLAIISVVESFLQRGHSNSRLQHEKNSSSLLAPLHYVT